MADDANYHCTRCDPSRPQVLCCSNKGAKLIEHAETHCGIGFPVFYLIIDNDSRYGGSASRPLLAVTTIHPDGWWVAVHELGHSVFGLGDEYRTQRVSTSANKANCDQ